MNTSSLVQAISPWIILFTVVLSAFIGAISGILVAWLSARQSYKNEILKLAIETAHLDFKTTHDIAEKKGALTYPISSFIAFHFCYLRLLDGGEQSHVALRKSLENISRLPQEYDEKIIPDYKTLYRAD